MTSPIYVTGKTTKKTFKNDLWKTPDYIAKSCTDLLVKLYPDIITGHMANVLDAGCDTGVWGEQLTKSCNEAKLEQPAMLGVELDDVPANSHYSAWLNNTNYLDFKFDHGQRADIVIGNPPYSLFQEFFEHTYNNMLPFNNGVIAWLLPLSYLQGIKRYKTIFHKQTLERVYVFIDRIKWTGNSPHDQHALFIWNKSFHGSFSGGWL